MLEASGLPSVQESGGSWGGGVGWGGEGRTGQGQSEIPKGSPFHGRGLCGGSLPPASISASSGGISVTDVDAIELSVLYKSSHINCGARVKVGKDTLQAQ